MSEISLNKKDHGLKISHRQEKSEVSLNVITFTTQKKTKLGHFSYVAKIISKGYSFDNSRICLKKWPKFHYTKIDHGLDIFHRQKKSDVFLNVKNFTTQKRPRLGHFS